MLTGKENRITFLAIIVLSIGIISALYVNASQTNKDTITINGDEYSFDELSMISSIITIQTNDGEKTGYSLEDIIQYTGISCTNCHEYTIKAADSYQQTVSWSVMKTGILTEENRVFFPDTPHSLWVRDIIEIEVN